MTAAELSDTEWLRVAQFEAAPVPPEIVELLLADVHRVHTERGSHIESAIDDDWSDLDKLRWQLAVVLHDAGLRRDAATLHPGHYTIDGVPQEAYELRYGSSSGISAGFARTWALITGISDGLRLARIAAEAGQ